MKIENNLTNEEKLVIEFSTYGYPINVDQLKKSYDFAKIDWPTLYAIAEQMGTTGLLIYNLIETGIILELEQNLSITFQEIAKEISIHSEKLIREATRIAELLERKGNKVVFLKGIVLSKLVYSDCSFARTFGDIDIVTSPHTADKVFEDFLNELGYSTIDDDNRQKLFKKVFQHYSPLSKDDIYAVDLHHRFNLEIQDDKIDVDEFISNSINLTIDGIDLNVPNIEDLIISTCHHLHRTETLLPYYQLKGHADLFNLIYKFSGQINWDRLIIRVKTQNLNSVIGYSLYHTNMIYKDKLGIDIIPCSILEKIIPENFHLEKNAIRSQVLLTNKCLGYWNDGTYLTRMFADPRDIFQKVKDEFYKTTIKENWTEWCNELGFDLKEEYLPRDPVKMLGNRIEGFKKEFQEKMDEIYFIK